MMGREKEIGTLEHDKLGDVLKKISILEYLLAVMRGGVVKVGTLAKPASL